MGMKYYQTSYAIENPLRVNVTSTASVLSSQIADDIETVRVVGNVDFWLTKGSSTITAGSSVGSGCSFHPAGVVEYINTQKKRFFAVEANSSSGFVCIAEVTQG